MHNKKKKKKTVKAIGKTLDEAGDEEVAEINQISKNLDKQYTI